mmetsp:Transcript_18054/g.18282  ORF Transcript_18054/g.18282 Transcript_18054/m.18282 type:complete len:177 (-) Transcript_18054:141-671(-)|eukprot:CAMPEP_0171306098 /NCGR_PEP_ID=MMETSP0816-20121228/16033_1 /TAXON_ID=420281 /ORGANISM="Proboscia inermis, Strain CCAP1064/1" /LENGTH=176 /DNA_ID=CAMNT_0011787433 /DNA_START=265 /DNA_END=795 /DNA_ORIENTATION=+
MSGPPGCSGMPLYDWDYCFDARSMDEDSDQLVDIFTSEQYQSSNLHKCQGDCDTDDNCADGLICYDQRGWVGERGPPRCSGIPFKTWDYCFDAGVINISEDSDQLLEIHADPGHIHNDFLLYKCQGNCDSDDNCVDGLSCYNQQWWLGGEGPPGCSGSRYENWNYCYDKGELQDGA